MHRVYLFSIGKGLEKVYHSRAKSIFESARDKDKLIRDMLAKGIKKYRVYEVDEDRIESKRVYIDHYKQNPYAFRPNEQPAVGSWVTIVSDTVVGKREDGYDDYFHGSLSCYNKQIGDTFKVEVNEYEKGAKDNFEICGIGSGDNLHYFSVTVARPATKGEVEDFFKKERILLGKGIQSLTETCKSRILEERKKHFEFIESLR